MKKFCVYIYYDVDGTPIYVGIDSTGKRWRKHWKHDTYLGNVLRKRERELGVSLYPEFIEADSWGDAQLGEVLYIWCFGRADLGHGTLFNLTDGGEGTYGVGPETRAKMAAAKKGTSLSQEHKDNIARAGKGRKLSVEHCEKISAAQRGKPKSTGLCAKLSQAHIGVPLSRAHCLAKSKPCTIDGIKIYESRKALIIDLGNGKHGLRHPNFRYLKW